MSSSPRTRACLLALLLAGPFTAAVSAATGGGDGRHLILVTGLGGESYYEELFQRWTESFYQVATERLSLSPGEITVLAPRPAAVPGVPARIATREGVLAAISAAAERTAAGDLVAVVLIGHGSAQATADGVRARFNLPGPDLSPRQLATALEALSDRTVVVVNGASASGPFLAPLSGPGRVVITATSSAAENQHARFMGHFVAAFADDAADLDRSSEVSLLEAFTFASRAVNREFTSARRLPTEHAVLDDSGDGVGSRAPAATPGATGDGALAARVVLAARRRDPGMEPADARARLRLDLHARGLVDRVQALTRRKASMEETLYRRQLEALLVELALNRRAWRSGTAP